MKCQNADEVWLFGFVCSIQGHACLDFGTHQFLIFFINQKAVQPRFPSSECCLNADINGIGMVKETCKGDEP